MMYHMVNSLLIYEKIKTEQRKKGSERLQQLKFSYIKLPTHNLKNVQFYSFLVLSLFKLSITMVLDLTYVLIRK